MRIISSKYQLSLVAIGLTLLPCLANACLEWDANKFGTVVKNNCGRTVNFVSCLGKECQPAYFGVISLPPGNEHKVADVGTAGNVEYCPAPKKPTANGCV